MTTITFEPYSTGDLLQESVRAHLSEACPSATLKRICTGISDALATTRPNADDAALLEEVLTALRALTARIVRREIEEYSQPDRETANAWALSLGRDGCPT